jgi:hypothetical protein
LGGKVSSLKDDNGNTTLSHADKESVLFNAFKNRLGTSQQTSMVFNLPSLIQPIDNLSELEHPFSCHEIDQIIKSLPSNKSPGPDGFNTDFVKKCWSVLPLTSMNYAKKIKDLSACAALMVHT